MSRYFNKKNIGKKFGKLTIIEFSHKDLKQRALYWKCLCDCGNKIVVRYSSLKQGNTKSCGCYQKQIAKQVILNSNHKRVLPLGLAAKRSLYRSYKQTANKRGIAFDLLFEDFINITSKNCEYCGIKPEQYVAHDKWNGSYKYNGIDRIDNNEGYTIKNSVPCCKWCNISKGNRTKQEFLDWIKSLHKHSIK